MQNISDAASFADSALVVSKTDTSARNFTLDTTFVLFFLAVEIGRTAFGFNLESILSAVTLAAFVVLPYFLNISGDCGSFARWLVGRTFVSAAGLMCGLVLERAAGTLLPEAVRFVPMALLIVAAIICCNIQIYGILRYRLAR